MNEYADPIPKLEFPLFSLKLSSGEQVLGELERYHESAYNSVYTLHNPMELMYVGNYLVLVPYALFAKSQYATFNSSNVVTALEVDDPLRELYRVSYHRTYERSRNVYNQNIHKSIAAQYEQMNANPENNPLSMDDVEKQMKKIFTDGPELLNESNPSDGVPGYYSERSYSDMVDSLAKLAEQKGLGKKKSDGENS